jgi:hypothetical protein
MNLKSWDIWLVLLWKLHFHFLVRLSKNESETKNPVYMNLF